MTAACQFCGREFSGAQAVKAHLKACPAYLARRKAVPQPQGVPLGRAEPSGSEQASSQPGTGKPGDFDLVGKLEKTVAARRLKMTLREMDEAEADLERQAEAKELERARAAEQEAERRRQAAQKRETELARAEQARRIQEQKEAAQQHRRQRLQTIKASVAGEWYAKPDGVPNLDDAVYRAIEQAFEGLNIDELSDSELKAIATAVRDRVYRNAKQKQDEIEAAEREIEEEKKQLAERKKCLIERGIAFAERELKAVEDLQFFDRYNIKQRIERELREDVVGDEIWEDIEDIILDIFDAEGIECDEFGDE